MVILDSGTDFKCHMFFFFFHLGKKNVKKSVENVQLLGRGARNNNNNKGKSENDHLLSL